MWACIYTYIHTRRGFEERLGVPFSHEDLAYDLDLVSSRRSGDAATGLAAPRPVEKLRRRSDHVHATFSYDSFVFPCFFLSSAEEDAGEYLELRLLTSPAAASADRRRCTPVQASLP